MKWNGMNQALLKADNNINQNNNEFLNEWKNELQWGETNWKKEMLSGCWSNELAGIYEWMMPR